MNFSGLLGVALALLVTSYTVLATTDNAAVFINEKGIMIVVVGTFAVAFLSFRFKRLWYALKIIVRKSLGQKQLNYMEHIQTIVKTSEIYRQEPKKALENLPENAHPFFKDGLKYMIDFGFSADELDEILTNALKGKKLRDDQEVKVWQTISKFPPAFGLIGAVVGMIALLQTIGQPGAENQIGPAMGVALVATFYGIFIANLILIPISENLAELSSEDIALRRIIKEGVLLIQEKRHPMFIEEYLKSFLSPSDREKEILGAEEASKHAA